MFNHCIFKKSFIHITCYQAYDLGLFITGGFIYAYFNVFQQVILCNIFSDISTIKAIVLSL